MRSLRPPVFALTLLVTASAALGVLVAVVASHSSVVASWTGPPDTGYASALPVFAQRPLVPAARAARVDGDALIASWAPADAYVSASSYSLSGVAVR